ELDLHHEVLVCADQAEQFVRRGLLNVRLQQQRGGERQNAEANVRDIELPVEINAQQHVPARGDRAFRCVPQNARCQTGHLKAEASQHVAQKQVLLETIAATPGAHQLLL